MTLLNLVPQGLNELLSQDVNAIGDFTGVFTTWDIVIVLCLSFGLSLVIGKTYQTTHKGISYSQGNVQTYVLMAVVVAVIMLVIGSNIARAFSLVGALSIVRFRNAVKESRDVGFVFWAMAVGMSCGTRFYLMAVFATFTIAGFVFLMHYFNFFARTVRERILLAEVDPDADPEKLFGELFDKTFQEHYLISMESMPGTGTLQLAYSTTIHGKFDSGKFLQEVRRLNGDKKVSLIEGQQQIDL
ncbi:MAG: DUF4956 domain-containing protein [bacterium]|nr:DUF4956 domain-containing protein [bacterium]